MRTATRRTARLSLAVALGAVILSGCGGTAGQDAAAQTSDTATSASQGSTTSAAAPTSTAQPTADAGPVQVSGQATVTTGDGYKATFDVRWHALQPVTANALFPDCPLMQRTGEQVYRAAVIEGTVAFPQVNGFSWPSTQKIELEPEPTGAEGNFSVCYQGPGLWDTNPADYGRLYVSPASGQTFALMLVQHAQRTPNAPEGTFDGGPDEWQFRIYTPGGGNGTCTLTGATDRDLVPDSCTLGYAG